MKQQIQTTEEEEKQRREFAIYLAICFSIVLVSIITLIISMVNIISCF